MTLIKLFVVVLYIGQQINLADGGELQKSGFSVAFDDIVFLIRSQPTKVNQARAERSKENIQSQCEDVDKHGCDVHLLHIKYPQLNAWTILPLLPRWKRDFGSKKWLFICEEDTQVNVIGLLNVLQDYDDTKEWFLGRGLVDQVPSIIHHYKFHNDVSQFQYPDLEAGWLLSVSLLKSLSTRWETEKSDMNFSIDVKHELALFIWNENNGQRLTSIPEICASGSPLLQNGVVLPKGECVTEHPSQIPQCGDPVPQSGIFFSVKTCQKYHKDRVVALLSTWGQFAENIVFYSDVKDSQIPTVTTGVPNVERGHCGKTIAIMNKFLHLAEEYDYNWLIIVDDDTILSVSRLQKLLSCYAPSDPLFIGERYGYGHGKNYGYDYITGGGGMVFSKQAVSEFLSKGCKCRADNDPDDMVLGMCAKSLNIPVTHSPLFHQAKPQEYSLGFLGHQLPISFHKHSNVDPVQIHKTWFLAADESEISFRRSEQHQQKEEL